MQVTTERVGAVVLAHVCSCLPENYSLNFSTLLLQVVRGLVKRRSSQQEEDPPDLLLLHCLATLLRIHEEREEFQLKKC